MVMYQHCWDSGPSLKHIQTLHNHIGEYMFKEKFTKSLENVGRDRALWPAPVAWILKHFKTQLSSHCRNNTHMSLLTCIWSSQVWCCAGEETGSPTSGTGSHSIWCWRCHDNPRPVPERTLWSRLSPLCGSRRFPLQTQTRRALSFS